MMVGETVKVAFGAIRANKMRSVLTMLGIVIGIAAVITMVALGEGASRAVQQRLAALGTNVLSVNPGQQMFGGVDRGGDGAKLTVDDANALLRAPQNITSLTPTMERSQQIEFGGNNANLRIVGTWPAYFDINNYTTPRPAVHGRRKPGTAPGGADRRASR